MLDANRSLDQMRRYAVARTLFVTTLANAIKRLGFVQADPIRAPARAQDLTLRHRVNNYHAGDLERRYPRLAIEEDFFVNYGFLPRATQRLMHPRIARARWTTRRWAKAHAVLEFVRERGAVHPRDVDAQFQHGTARNWFGGSGRASTGSGPKENRQPRDAGFGAALRDEAASMAGFLGLADSCVGASRKRD